MYLEPIIVDRISSTLLPSSLFPLSCVLSLSVRLTHPDGVQASSSSYNVYRSPHSTSHRPSSPIDESLFVVNVECCFVRSSSINTIHSELYCLSIVLVAGTFISFIPTVSTDHRRSLFCPFLRVVFILSQPPQIVCALHIGAHREGVQNKRDLPIKSLLLQTQSLSIPTPHSHPTI